MDLYGHCLFCCLTILVLMYVHMHCLYNICIVYTTYALFIQHMHCLYGICIVYTTYSLFIQHMHCLYNIYIIYTTYTLVYPWLVTMQNDVNNMELICFVIWQTKSVLHEESKHYTVPPCLMPCVCRHVYRFNFTF